MRNADDYPSVADLRVPEELVGPVEDMPVCIRLWGCSGAVLTSALVAGAGRLGHR